MKKYILPSNVNWYRANMHCHSNISDGSFTPDKIKKVYKEKGYSIVAFTDHDILLDHSYLNDDSFLHIFTRHVEEYKFNVHYQQKDSFQWFEEDVIMVMKKVFYY